MLSLRRQRRSDREGRRWKKSPKYCFYFFIVIMHTHLQDLLFLLFSSMVSVVLFFFFFWTIHSVFKFLFSDKFRGISSECNTISSFFCFFFLFHGFHAVTEDLDNGT